MIVCAFELIILFVGRRVEKCVQTMSMSNNPFPSYG
jgi:hypothetical protein